MSDADCSRIPEESSATRKGRRDVVLPLNGQVDTIYARYSCELQRTDSIDDQERRCREGLQRMGIPDEGFILLADEAISGALETRPNFDRLKELLYSGRLRTLVVADQSRLSRGDNAKALIKDIVFHGGRFISIAEGIDTNRKGWQTAVGVNEIHHAQSNQDTAERVRGGLEGRIRDGNGSAGDYPYGYTSEFVDAVAAAGYRGRGPRPKRKVLIEPAAAAIVRKVFRRFGLGNESIGAIARWWDSHKDEFPRIGRSRVHHAQLRRMLANEKYIGTWTFGVTTTVRDGQGNKKQVPAKPDQTITVVSRPDLRIIEQELWDRVQARLAELKRIYGMKPAGKKRGPAQYYRLLYQKTLLCGLVTCGGCAARLRLETSRGEKRLVCPNHRMRKCPMATSVSYAPAEKAVLEIIAQVLQSRPDWLMRAMDCTRSRLEKLAQAMPDELVQTRCQLDEVCKQLDRLVDAVARGLESSMVRSRLMELEAQKSALEARLTRMTEVQTAQSQMPDDQWISEQLQGLTTLLRQEMATAAPHLRPLLGKAVAERIRHPGKKRGYIRLHVTLDGWAVLKPVLEQKLPTAVLSELKPTEGAPGQEFIIQLGGPSRLDNWAQTIVEWREQGMKWTEISRRTGLKPASAYTAYKRWQQSHREN